MASCMMLMSSYLFTAEQYPRPGQLARQKAFRKENQKPSIMLHNKSNYDITTENAVINPGESKKVHLPENLELKLFLGASNDDLTLQLKDPLPRNVCFTEKSDLIELTYDGECIKSYICT
jgi:hypothetical protein